MARSHTRLKLLKNLKRKKWGKRLTRSQTRLIDGMPGTWTMPDRVEEVVFAAADKQFLDRIAHGSDLPECRIRTRFIRDRHLRNDPVVDRHAKPVAH